MQYLFSIRPVVSLHDFLCPSPSLSLSYSIPILRTYKVQAYLLGVTKVISTYCSYHPLSVSLSLSSFRLGYKPLDAIPFPSYDLTATPALKLPLRTHSMISKPSLRSSFSSTPLPPSAMRSTMTPGFANSTQWFPCVSASAAFLT